MWLPQARQERGIYAPPAIHAVKDVPGVPPEMLIPERTWADQEAFAATSRKLAGLFIANFTQYESGGAPAVKAAGPKP